MRITFKCRVERVRQNNGITEVFVIKRANYADPDSQEESAIYNIQSEPGMVINEGDECWAELRLTGLKLVR
jgi:hypothetical protein